MEKINILSFNIQNFKTNYYFFANEIVNSNIDVCFSPGNLKNKWSKRKEFGKIKRSFYSLYSLGCNSYGLNSSECIHESLGREICRSS
jgi:hypothetical protein